MGLGLVKTYQMRGNRIRNVAKDMKFEGLPQEIKEFKEKFGESELTRFWDQPMIHTSGFSPNQLWQPRKIEILALLKRLR